MPPQYGSPERPTEDPAGLRAAAADNRLSSRAGWRTAADRLLRAAIEVLVLALVCLSPWAFGGVRPGDQVLLFAGVGAILVCWAVRMLLEGRVNWQRCPVATCLALILLVGVVQLIPLRESLLSRLSPAAGRIYTNLLPAQHEVLGTGERIESAGAAVGATLSLYPAATRRQLLRILAVLLLFLAVRNNISPSGGLRRLSVAVLVNGACLSLFAFIQFFTSPRGVLYWTFSSAGQVFGPFVNRNHFAFHTNIAIALGFGLLLCRGWGPARSDRSRRLVFGAARRRQQPAWHSLQGAAGVLQDPAAVWIGVALGLMLAAVVFCLSRGGFVALLGGGTLCAMLVLIRTPYAYRAGAALIAVAIAVGLVGWFGHERIEARLGTFWSGELLEGDRIALLVRGWSCVQDFPIWGTGYGTFRFVEPMYLHDPADVGWIFEHAHNEYLEAVIEGGTLRLLLALAAIGLVYRLGWRAFRAHQDAPSRGLVLGGLFAFTTVVIHSFVEFGLHMPAIAILVTVLVAYLSGLGGGLAAAPDGTAPVTGGSSSWLAGVAAVTAVLLGWVLVRGGYEAYGISEVRAATDRLRNRLGAANAEHQVAVLRSEARLRTPDAELEVALGEAHLEYDLTRLGSEAAGGARRRTSEHRLQALRHFIRARDLCPILPVAHVRLAANREYLRRADSRRTYLDRARRVAPADPQLWFFCGTYELSVQDHQRAWSSWRRSLELSDRFLTRILAAARPHLGPQEMLAEILPNRPGVLLAAARYEAAAAESTQPGAAERRDAYLRRALALLRAQHPLSAEEWAQLAEIHDALNEPEAAIIAYEAALARQPEHVIWRYAVAQQLYEQDRLDEAREQLRVALMYEPQHSRALALLKDVARRRVARAVESQQPPSPRVPRL